jgi:hypothetical protein
MKSMLDTIIPKSDQLNADDLIGGPRTITVSEVRITGDEQPVSIHFEGDNGKPYKLCKSMRRVLVNVWGADAKAYIGRSMTIYRDEKVVFGGVAVGGIRISHMSDITKDVTMALTATRANRKPYTVKPLVLQTDPEADKIARGVAAMVKKIEAVENMDALKAITGDEEVVRRRAFLTKNYPNYAATVDAAVSAALARFESPQDDGFPVDADADAFA